MRERIGALGDRLAAAAWVAPSAAVALFGLLLARLDVVTDPAVQARLAAALVAHLDRPAIVKRWRELYSTHLAASALVLERLRATPTAVAVRVPHPPRNHGLPLASRTHRGRESASVRAAGRAGRVCRDQHAPGQWRQCAWQSRQGPRGACSAQGAADDNDVVVPGAGTTRMPPVHSPIPHQVRWLAVGRSCK
jgi:hypothetical protein